MGDLKMSFGSFNWSKGAMRSNYENMMILDRHDPDHRRIMKGYESEFEAFGTMTPWRSPSGKH